MQTEVMHNVDKVCIILSMAKKKIQVNCFKREQMDKHNARKILRYYVNSGKIKVEPCEICFSNLNVEGHHSDYSQPLKVNWLCKDCHMTYHRRLSNYKWFKLRII